MKECCNLKYMKSQHIRKFVRVDSKNCNEINWFVKKVKFETLEK